MSERLQVFGIRHHGPGSATSLLRALDRCDPDEVLIEGPTEGNPLIPEVEAGLVPPVALLVYAEDDPGSAVFYPFAEWSPEWVALGWALRRGRPVRFIDQPVASRLRLRREAGAEPAPPGTEEPPPADRLGALAALAGYPDGESWWAAHVEESGSEEDLFVQIEAAMEALREREGTTEEDELREAFQREEVAAALARTQGPVAAVVGAWHAPALRRGPRPTDAARRRSARKGIPVSATWVPWTDARLALASGYGAGLTAPGWYRLLWETRQTPTARAISVRWQTRAARALRGLDRPAPPSQVMDAVQLTEALCALRGLSRPGLSELQDACLATLCSGELATWRRVEQEVLVGRALGQVPEGVPSTPLAADLARQQRLLKLRPEGREQDLSLDLRTALGLGRSHLLHRLNLLEVPWGALAETGTTRGTFRESWVLRWEPEFSVRLVEALRWGTTLEAAATQRASAEIGSATLLSDLAERVRLALLAGLGPAAQAGLSRMAELATAGAEVLALAEAIPPLVDVLRYGTARALALDGVTDLVHALQDKVEIGLVLAARHLDRPEAEALQRALARLDAALGLFDEGARRPGWLAALETLGEDRSASPLLGGFATRRLHEAGRLGSEAVATRLSANLSPGVPLDQAAAWLEGFLGEAGHLLLHDRALFQVVDAWLVGLEEGALLEALPLLRRATAPFSANDRRRLLQAAAGELRPLAPARAAVHTGALDEGLPLLRLILGLQEEG